MGKKRKQTAEEDQPNDDASRPAEEPTGVVQDPRMKKLVKKFRLDKMAESKLCEVMSKWDEDKQYRYFKDLGKVLGDAVKPSATVMIIVKKIAAGEHLCRPAFIESRPENALSTGLELSVNRRRGDK
ncbi:RNF8 [Symbiodinium pilosum]|uniref:RNF8 protein n=1 Tax=Symbiodinium pilosum TaxID=2952 RepID=A0A812VGF6_SYMPI|nr:RNF8 [Symbiodinium pilosum]